MAKVKKVDPEWFPSEKLDLQVGEVIEITDPYWLIKDGKVIPVDDAGVEVLSTDPDVRVKQLERKLAEVEAKTDNSKISTPAETVVEKTLAEKRLDNLAKAREARKAKNA